MSTVQLTIPGDRCEWQPLQQGVTHCAQTAALYLGDQLQCYVTVTWPTPVPGTPVVCRTEGRNAAHD